YGRRKYFAWSSLASFGRGNPRDRTPRAAIFIVFLTDLSWYTGYVIGQFKIRYPHVHTMGDTSEILLGSFRRELFGIDQLLLLIVLMASHIEYPHRSQHLYYCLRCGRTSGMFYRRPSAHYG
ncbi:hypothetical protein N7467_000015, partial [Penicillium canescens]